jgi:hypothetical protein
MSSDWFFIDFIVRAATMRGATFVGFSRDRRALAIGAV